MRFGFSLFFACVGCAMFVQTLVAQTGPLPGIANGPHATQPATGYPLHSGDSVFSPIETQPFSAQPATHYIQPVGQASQPNIVFEQPHAAPIQGCASCGFAHTEVFDAHGRCRSCGVKAKLGEIRNHVPSSAYLYNYLNSVPTPRFDSPSIGPFSSGGTTCRERKGQHFGFGR